MWCLLVLPHLDLFLWVKPLKKKVYLLQSKGDLKGEIENKRKGEMKDHITN